MSKAEWLRRALDKAPRLTPAQLASIRSALPPVVAK